MAKPEPFNTFWRALSAEGRKAFASACETSVGHLSNVASGFKPAGESLAINIDRESKGEVPCESLRNDVDWAYLRASARSTTSARRRA